MVDHPTLVSGTGGKTLAGLEQIRLVGSRLPNREQLAFHSVAPSSQESEGFLDSSAQTNLRICNTVESSSTLGIPVDTTAAATTFTKAAVTTNFATGVNPDLAGPSQPEESEGSDDSFYEPPTLDPSEAKRLDRVAPPAFFSTLRTMDYDQLYTEFNVGAARQVCLGAEVRSRAEHELELKEKLRAKYAARGRLLEEKDLEILRRIMTSLCLTLVSLVSSHTWMHAMVAVARGDKINLLGVERDRLASEVAKASYINAVKALEDVDFPLVNLLKSKKDAGMDGVLDCFLLDGHIAGLPEAAYLHTYIEQLSIPIHHTAEGAKKHAAALRQLMMEIVSAPLSSQTWVGEASTSVAPLSVEDYDEEDTDEALGSVVAVPKLFRTSSLLVILFVLSPDVLAILLFAMCAIGRMRYLISIPCFFHPIELRFLLPNFCLHFRPSYLFVDASRRRNTGGYIVFHTSL
ncbi:hypothetical protein Tco_0167337 [Tanacetum coccineum]